MRALALLLCSALLIMSSCGKKTPSESRVTEAKARVNPDLRAEMKARKIAPHSPLFIRAFKEERELEIFLMNKESGKFELFRTYPIAGLSGVLGPKLAEGDGQVPEGFYAVAPSAMNPKSNYHLAFNIGYPNAFDRANDRTGSFIMVHGSNVSVGCLAMTNEKIEEIYTLCDDAFEGGQPFFRIHIFPFRMTLPRMEESTDDKWLPFWQNLKVGYDFFEDTRIPPNITVTEKEYVFE